MLDRTEIPQVKEIDKIDYQVPQIHKLDNGIKIYTLKSDNSPVIKMDMIFKAGIEYQINKFDAVFANSLIKEAPEGMEPDEVAEKFDFYGSFIDSFVSSESAGIRLYVPVNFIKDVLPLFADLFLNPSLPEKEFEISKNKQYQFIQNNLKKTKYLAMRGLNTELFGRDNPRGYVITPDDVMNVQIENVREFVRKYYRSDNCYIIISGMLDSNIINLCNKYLGRTNDIKWNDKSSVETVKYGINESGDYYKLIELENSVQSTIFCGKNLGIMSNRELIDLGILNTVLGGYFGSRLMKNIREDKGYTYGIGSFVVEYPDMVTLKITSDVGTNVTKDAIKEIFSEIGILREELIPESELKLVKNFMNGDLMSGFDGVLNSSEIWEKLISSGKDKDFIDLQIERIREITSEELRDLARKHFTEEGFHTVVAGKVD